MHQSVLILSKVSVVLSFSTLVLVAFVLVRWYFRKSPYVHLPGPTNSSWLGYLLDMHDGESLENYHYPMCQNYGHTVRLRGGMFGLQGDGLYITDPLALNSVLVRDQANFPESRQFTGLFGIIHRGDGLVSVQGREHKKQRKLMNPIFTAAHVSRMMPLFYNVAHQLRDKLDAEVRGNKEGKRIDILDYLTRTALELISQGGLGHSFNSFTAYSPQFTEFNEALRTVLPTASNLFIILPYLESWRKMEPVWLRRLLARGVDYLPWSSARQFKRGAETMQHYCTWLYEEKKKLIEKGGISALEGSITGGRDLASLLMVANTEIDEKDRMPDNIVIANISTIVLAGQETTSGALARLLHVMVSDVDTQSKLRAEINEHIARKGGELDYNELNALPLLDAVCREILRLYPPVSFISRDTSADTLVPLQFPVQDPVTGVETRQLLITKGTPVYVGISAANRSTTIWGPDAAEFKPERWLGKVHLDEAINGVRMPAIYSNSMTFLGGGRACPGMKFSLLEIKLVLAVLLPHFMFEPVTEEICWHLGISMIPFVKGQRDLGPSVPLIMKLI